MVFPSGFNATYYTFACLIQKNCLFKAIRLSVQKEYGRKPITWKVFFFSFESLLQWQQNSLCPCGKKLFLNHVWHMLQQLFPERWVCWIQLHIYYTQNQFPATTGSPEYCKQQLTSEIQQNWSKREYAHCCPQ